MTTTQDIISAYLAAFNRGDWAGMLALLADDVVHDINQGGAEHGKAAFAGFLDRMARCYREELRDIVILVSADGTRAAAEFQVHGKYLAQDAGLPPARGQRYTLPAGAFFGLKDGRITRVTMYYNLREWLRQVDG
ncbi:MAG: nuclear transport factor 2 family protein [Roseomonas sp.]|nr:nuclear transport factor 2 family protein [Roseomonas sp.]MCA3327064.1 nuclear transport factor 2 family protein [Roseomonas sp.]MCA3330977.1 nuclear transport factor 2 family protein [Roseomonas sp.]MCA3334061.1 nuclear transport factor 2 family protein [Roseomonas sp.]MCA3346082.1 nuclear transport factor 2 family protein [Roseomonas sp.]